MQLLSIQLLVHEIRPGWHNVRRKHFKQLLPKKTKTEPVSSTSDSNLNFPFLKCKFKTPYENNLERHFTPMHPERDKFM